MPERIALIGAGRVGGHLGRRLHLAGWPIVQVYSRSPDKAKTLAAQLGAGYTGDLNAITGDADLYIIAVSDDAIGAVAGALRLPPDKLVVHTSGATPSDELHTRFARYGVFYPLQTFSADREPDFSTIPICLFAADTAGYDLLERLARSLGSPFYAVDDRQRFVLHVAAVFVNNFTNYLYQVGEDIVHSEQLSFDLLRPLILETAQKIQSASPAAMQTGPAIRGDVATVERHLAYLASRPEYAELYRMLTKGINGEMG